LDPALLRKMRKALAPFFLELEMRGEITRIDDSAPIVPVPHVPQNVATTPPRKTMSKEEIGTEVRRTASKDNFPDMKRVPSQGIYEKCSTI
jgi:hypothetical protein